MALADLDGWGEEAMLLARLLAIMEDKAPIDYLPGWQWARKK
ncbi:MAG TPA: hypothetical protein VMX74_07015 [Pirellulales bacterium]|nr:hypothetical protein [Pirellulales bacterium]